MTNLNQTPVAGQAKHNNVSFFVILGLFLLVLLALVFGPRISQVGQGEAEPVARVAYREHTGQFTDQRYIAQPAPNVVDLGVNPELKVLEDYVAPTVNVDPYANPELRLLNSYTTPVLGNDLYTNPELKVLDYPQSENSR